MTARIYQFWRRFNDGIFIFIFIERERERERDARRLKGISGVLVRDGDDDDDGGDDDDDGDDDDGNP